MRPHDDEFDPAFAPPAGPAKGPARGWLDRALGWLEGRARPLLILAVVFQVGVLLSMIGLAARPLIASGSRVVLLQVVPVDPRDLFRGDYVTLSYDVSRVSPVYEPGQTVRVEIVPGPDGLHFHKGMGGTTATDPGPGVWLRGTVVRRGLAQFGIEKFFVPEGQGLDYERAARSQRLWAEVSVAPDGQAGLRRLVIE